MVRRGGPTSGSGPNETKTLPRPDDRQGRVPNRGSLSPLWLRGNDSGPTDPECVPSRVAAGSIARARRHADGVLSMRSVVETADPNRRIDLGGHAVRTW